MFSGSLLKINRTLTAREIVSVSLTGYDVESVFLAEIHQKFELARNSLYLYVNNSTKKLFELKYILLII